MPVCVFVCALSHVRTPPPLLCADVMVGSALGMLFSWLCYRQHYPSLQDPECHRPLRHREAVPSKQERKLANSNYILPL